MPLFERDEKRGDRRAKYVRVHGEAMRPQFRDGKIQVECKTLAGARDLRRKGFREVVAPQAAPAPTREDFVQKRRERLFSLNRDEQKQIARKLSVRGRSKMNEPELIEAILAIEFG